MADTTRLLALIDELRRVVSGDEAPEQGEAAVEALARYVYVWVWRDEDEDPDTSPERMAHVQPTTDGISCRMARSLLAALDRGAIPGYGPTGAGCVCRNCCGSATAEACAGWHPPVPA